MKKIFGEIKEDGSNPLFGYSFMVADSEWSHLKVLNITLSFSPTSKTGLSLTFVHVYDHTRKI